MRRLFANAAAMLAAVLLAVAVLEIGLRLWPAAISQAVLANFESPLRREIAALLDLPLKQARRCIAPEERSDHGPELCLIAPNMQYRQPVDPADVAAGGLAKLAAERGFVPVVTYIPAAYTANAATVTFMDPTVGRDLAAMSRAQRAYLQQQCAIRQLTWIDLTEPIQAAIAASDLAYFPYNLHPTPAGHMMVAAALAPTLRELLAADGSPESRSGER